MCGSITEHAEVAWSIHQTAAEVVHPDSIDEHTRQQRMCSVGQPPCPGKPTPRGRNGFVVGWKLCGFAIGVQHSQTGGREFLFRLFMIAADEQERVGNLAGDLGHGPHKFFFRLCAAELRGTRRHRLQLIGSLEIVQIQ